jgi:hypothetical protein
MHSNDALTPGIPRSGRLDIPSLTNLAMTGEVEIAGRRYVTAVRLAATLGVTVRTLLRFVLWRAGTPHVSVRPRSKSEN